MEEWKALKSSASIFVVRLPRINKFSKKIQTSGTTGFPFTFVAAISTAVKVHERNTSAATCMAIVAPCPCCFGSIIISILLVAPTVGLGAINLSVYVAAALVITIIVTYFASNYFVKLINKPYPIVLGNFMFFLGIYFLLSSLFLPNITEMLSNTMDPMTISSINTLIVLVVVFVVLLKIGRAHV